MTVTAYCRGWACYWSGEEWLYVDNDSPLDERRPCKQCGKSPTPEGYDACLGELENVINACCGHGVEDGYIQMETSEMTEQQERKVINYAIDLDVRCQVCDGLGSVYHGEDEAPCPGCAPNIIKMIRLNSPYGNDAVCEMYSSNQHIKGLLADGWTVQGLTEKSSPGVSRNRKADNCGGAGALTPKTPNDSDIDCKLCGGTGYAANNAVKTAQSAVNRDWYRAAIIEFLDLLFAPGKEADHPEDWIMDGQAIIAKHDPYDEAEDRTRIKMLQDIAEHAVGLESENDRLEEDCKKLRGVLRQCQSMAGSPDAAQGCRNIISLCEIMLKKEVPSE